MNTQVKNRCDIKVDLLHSNSPGYHALSQFVQDLRGDGGLFLLGGHYEYPGVPSPSAVDSARLLVDVQNAIGSTNSLFRLFLNDIGASLSCVPGYQCSISDAETVGELSDLSSEWIDHVESLERTLIADPRNWRTCADGIARHLRSLVQAEMLAHPLLQRLSTPERLKCAEIAPPDWLADLERLVYASVKSRFRPLLLTAMTQRLLPSVLFEKTMNNGTSRLLHRLAKLSPTETGLHVNDVGFDAREFTVFGPDRIVVHLRREELTDNGVKASNKCSALLAQLFAYSCKQVRSVFRGNDRRITVCYFIPCYDRSRLFYGMHAFCELFSDVTKFFDVAEVELCSGFFMTPDRSVVKCDTFLKQGSRPPKIRTVRLICDAAHTNGAKL